MPFFQLDGNDNTFNGSSRADTIQGGYGNDTIEGRGGDDLLLGNGTGVGETNLPISLRDQDLLLGGEGEDTLVGNRGADTLQGGPGDDVYRGGLESDTYIIEDVGDRIEGEIAFTGDFDQAIVYVPEYRLPSFIEGGFVAINEPFILYAGAGHNMLGTEPGVEADGAFYAGANDDTIYGTDGDNTLHGGIGDDLMIGDAGNDLYVVDTSDNVIRDEGPDDGYDVVASNTISLYLVQYPGVEEAHAVGEENLSAFGRDDANVTLVTGEWGDEDLNGGSGRDRLFGSFGHDTLKGGMGRDYLSGGLGDDILVYTHASESPAGFYVRDVIGGFDQSSTRADVVDLSGIDADRGRSGDQEFESIRGRSFSGDAGELRFTTGGVNTLVQADLDGDRRADFELYLKGFSGLTAEAFVLTGCGRAATGIDRLAGPPRAD